ncbi:gp78 [Mycobacterium phage Barnyard]|uniref:Uncharacterized protein n=1 Tax=Mycobacterium phage Barnyard TaxID=205880 RepID=Q855Z4_9CAUD|nr:gp78 [Mycobacterium phage Barnyard]AAN02132.1 hypothetical protein PBI_BARNYARD_78 [Mycobacterium phage Barnyard]
MAGEYSEVAQLTRIADALESFTKDRLDPNTGESLGSWADNFMEMVLNPPMTVVNNVAAASEETDDLDPTFAALAGACYSMADQLENCLNEPDQFKKAQALRNLVSQIRSLADKYAESAAAEDYRRVMQSRIRKVESNDGPEPEPETPVVEPDPRYKPKGSWKGPQDGE